MTFPCVTVARRWDVRTGAAVQCVVVDAAISSASVDASGDILACTHGSTVSFFNTAEFV